jgi:hypothetical protein
MAAGNVHPLIRSFAGGEITPEMFGRLDLDKFQTGVARAKNMRILPHGPVQNRAGLKYVLEVKDISRAVRVIPFAYSASQTIMLEFGHQYVRFHTQGLTLLETGLAITGITQANPGVLTYTGSDPANGDWMYLSGIVGMTELNSRFVKVANVNAGANTFQLTDIHGGANINTTDFTAYASGGTAARVYEIASPFVEADLFDLHYTQSADVLTITHPSYAPRELRRTGATNWAFTSASFAPAIATPAGPTMATGGPGGGTPIVHTYTTTAVSADSYEESLASPTGGANVDLTVAGNYASITPAAVAGAVRYNIYKEANGGLAGYIGQSDGTAFLDYNVTPDMSQTPPEANTPFASSDNYPSTVTYIEQRRCFAGTNNRPQHIWMTKSATEGNLSQSVPLRDNDAIILRIAASQQNRIRHVIGLGDLIALTAGGEFRLYAAGTDVLTPSSTTPKPQSYVGASNVQPVVAENAVLYEQASGGHMREFAYAGDGLNGALYKTNDISILAPHLFDDYTMTDIAFSRTASCPSLMVSRSDGKLLTMTYVPGQNVRAWSWWETNGEFESVSCVTEGAEDVAYFVVKRTINGREVRNIECAHTRRFTEKEDAFFVDCGLTYDGAAATTISNLWHLEGETVVATADGAVVRNLTVEDGQITLPAAAQKVHIGLSYTSNMKTLPLSWQADGYGQGIVKNINRVGVRVSNSSGVRVGPADGTLYEIKQRTTEVYGAAPEMLQGWQHTNIAPKWDADGAVEIEQTDPLPVTILAMVLHVSVGG